MASRVLPVGLLLATLLADAQGLHRLGFYVLVAAIPAAAVAALSAFGDLVELPGRSAGEGLARLEVVLGGLGLVLVLVAAATRGQASETVPALAGSATVGALLVLGPGSLAGLLRRGAPRLRRVPAR